MKQAEPEAQEIALAIELFTSGSLNTFAKPTNVDVTSRLVCYDILDLGKQLLPIGMLVVLDSILNRITQNRAKGRNTFIIIDEIYLLFQHEYSANFLFTLWKRVRKYGAFCTGITQNVDDLLQSHTARTMLDIKALDKAADVTHRAKNAYIRTKEQAEQTQRSDHGSYVEYAEDKVKDSTNTAFYQTGQAVAQQGKTAVEKIKQPGATDMESYHVEASGGSTMQRGNTNTVGSQAEQRVTSPKTKEAVKQNPIPSEAKKAANRKTAPASKGKAKRKYTLVKPNELAKRRFVQSRAKERFSQTSIRSVQTIQNSVYHPAEKAVWHTGCTIGRPDSAGGKAAKETSKGAIKTAQRSIKVSKRTVQAAIKTSQAAKTVVKTAQATKRAAKAAAFSVRTAAKAIAVTVKMAVAAVKGLLALLIAGGWAAVVIILVVCLAALLSGSVFGVFFSNESYDVNSPIMTEVVSRLNEEFTAEIQRIQDENPHDSLELSGSDSSPMEGNPGGICGQGGCRSGKRYGGCNS